jgi:environmental stress-induced protein Ves
LRILRSETYRQVPWRNGKGQTAEIMAFPEDAADFDWRISMAPVVADGAFSLFPGIDRVLTVIAGRGLLLTLGDAAPVTLTGAPLAFPGDIACQATLTAGPITDLNVMTRRGQWRAVVRHATTPGTLPGAAHHLIFAHATPLAGEVAGEAFSLGLRDTLHLTPAEGAALAFTGRWLDIQLLPLI